MVYSRATTSVRAERVLRSALVFCPRAIVRAATRGMVQESQLDVLERGGLGARRPTVPAPAARRPPHGPALALIPHMSRSPACTLCIVLPAVTSPPKAGATRCARAIFAGPTTSGRGNAGGRDEDEGGAGCAELGLRGRREPHVGVLSDEREGPEGKARRAGRRARRARRRLGLGLSSSSYGLVQLPTCSREDTLQAHPARYGERGLPRARAG